MLLSSLMSFMPFLVLQRVRARLPVDRQGLREPGTDRPRDVRQLPHRPLRVRRNHFRIRIQVSHVRFLEISVRFSKF